MSVRILTGDCRDLLCGLPDASVQCCVTSPPYFGLRDYGVDGQIGLEPTPEDFVAAMVEVFREVRRVLRDDGTLWLNLGDSYAAGVGGQSRGGPPSGKSTLKGNGHKGGGPKLKSLSAVQITASKLGASAGPFSRTPALKPKDLIGIPWRVAFALQAGGWYLRSDIIWHKPNPMPESVTDRPTSAHEHVFLLTKSERYFYDADAIREAESVPDWDDGSRVFGGVNKHGASAQHGDRTTGRRATSRKRGLPPRHAQYPDSSDQSGLDAVARGAGRNARNVWTIATRPFPEAHFATFPPDLAERCVRAGTSERGACPHCGSPWVRIVEKRLIPTAKVSYGSKVDARDLSADPQDQGANRAKDGHIPGMRRDDITLGWRQSCSCPEHAPVPQIVLDPFGGAGTTGLVADRLQRHAILLELNPKYAAMARQRICADGILFAEVEIA